uniref:Hydrophobin n=1 Tax=Sparassis latifolia TaxID=1202976 RepID=A0A6B9M0I7_9APHY|nr:fruiting body protein SC4 [Sparassis latifolia]
MFSRIATFTAVLALPFLAVASPTGQTDQCNVGSLQCCNSVISPDSTEGLGLLGLIGVAVGSVTGSLGVTCSPITVIGVLGGSSCEANPVCCTDNSYGNLVSLGCIPVSL